MRLALRSLIGRPDIAPFFAPGLMVRTEATLIDRDGHALRPDRVVRSAEGTRVLDIKTGAPADAHAAQVRGYAHLLRELGEPSVRAFLLYVSDGTLIEVPA
ncbi:MAG: hypothetical protein QM724_01675 [Flavobacteriales bacterium]